MLREVPAAELEALLSALEAMQSENQHSEKRRKEKMVELFTAKVSSLVRIRCVTCPSAKRCTHCSVKWLTGTALLCVSLSLRS